MTNRRRILLAQLNCLLRLAGRREVVRYHGSTRRLSAKVDALYRA